MPAGLVKIVPSGAQDLFLTGTPEITFFKIVYRRYTNFSIESFELKFEDQTGFDIQSDLTLPIIADLIYKIYVKIKIPYIAFKRPIDEIKLNILQEKHKTAIETL